MGKRDLAWFEFLEISYVAQGPFPDCNPEPKKKFQPLPVASTSYHDFTKIHYPIILLKDEWKQHKKNPVIIFI